MPVSCMWNAFRGSYGICVEDFSNCLPELFQRREEQWLAGDAVAKQCDDGSSVEIDQQAGAVRPSSAIRLPCTQAHKAITKLAATGNP